jgi:hypothetical protein
MRVTVKRGISQKRDRQTIVMKLHQRCVFWTTGDHPSACRVQAQHRVEMPFRVNMDVQGRRRCLSDGTASDSIPDQVWIPRCHEELIRLSGCVAKASVQCAHISNPVRGQVAHLRPAVKPLEPKHDKKVPMPKNERSVDESRIGLPSSESKRSSKAPVCGLRITTQLRLLIGRRCPAVCLEKTDESLEHDTVFVWQNPAAVATRQVRGALGRAPEDVRDAGMNWHDR